MMIHSAEWSYEATGTTNRVWGFVIRILEKWDLGIGVNEF